MEKILDSKDLKNLSRSRVKEYAEDLIGFYPYLAKHFTYSLNPLNKKRNATRL